MAVPAKPDEIEVPNEWDPVQYMAAELLAKGHTRPTVARKMEKYLITTPQSRQNPVRRRTYALRKLRRWQKRKDFRDLVWQLAVERLDTRTPDILDGVAGRASNGRVDAAKLALELSGRYSPKGGDQPTAVQIVVNGVPRPAAVSGDVVDGELIAEDEA